MTMNVACQRFCEPDDLFGDRCACALDENDDSDLVDDVIDMASDILVWMSHGRITGICLNTFRPMKVGGGTCGTLVGEYSDYETARFGGMDVIALPGRDVQVLEVEIDGDPVTLGLLADKVYEVTEVSTRHMQQTPRLGSHWRPEFIRFITKWSEEFVIVPDMSRILG